jgi:GT2 family glycosyltransferase
MDVSVAIVSFNTRTLLARAIEAVQVDTGHCAVEIIVVDNASQDGSAEMVRARFPAVTVLANADNRYYAAGNNQAVAASRGRHVLILNPDVELGPGALAGMVAYLDRHPDVGALGIPMRFPDGRLQRNGSRQRTYRQLLLEYTVVGLLRPRARRRALERYWYGDWDRSTERDVDVIPGSCLMVRREVVDRVGVFDERLRLYFTEDDWCARIRLAGFRIVHAPVGEAVHPESASVEQVRALARRIYFEDMVRYTAKHFGRGRAAWLWTLTRPTRLALDLSAAWRSA